MDIASIIAGLTTGPIGAIVTGILGPIIRPIIQEELAELKSFISELFHENQKYKEFDKEVDDYMPKLAAATLSEDRWALVQELKNKRASINSK